MQTRSPHLFLILAGSFVVSSSVFADVPPEQTIEVEHLLSYVEQSDCVMLRNGSEHKGPKAREHIQQKYDYFRDDISSTEQFIEYSATKSTMSGKYYEVQCAGKENEHAQDWMLRELQVYREHQQDVKK